ncbi:MAG: HAMP domain-containing sensor histidine kinase [Magnetospirillum sp.]|jgi:cell cycle sensor histidine kinase DivJ|nr:HAMP domain-containing sensor histidine kinase [Magnetospirillum sp.]
MRTMRVEVALDALAERVADPVVRLARDGRILFANAAFARDFGPAPTNVMELAANGANSEALVATILAGTEAELPLTDASGRLCMVTIDAMLSGDDGHMVVLRPQHPEALRAGDVFLATASHELRTPLNAILGFAQMLEEGLAGPMTDRQREYAASIRAGGTLLMGIVEDLLEAAQDDGVGERMADSAFDLAALARAQRDLMRAEAQARRIEIASALPDAPVPMRGDARKLAKAVLDLLANAIRFSPIGGTVTIGIGESTRGGIALWVGDQGPGIPPTDKRGLGAPQINSDNAYMQRTPGAGMSLAIVRHYVELHGGQLELGAGPGGGAAVTIRLPADRRLSAAEMRRFEKA